MTIDDDTAARQLRGVADSLGLPVEAFIGGAEPRKLEDAAECQRLWDRLRTDAGRAAVLDYLLKVLDEGG